MKEETKELDRWTRKQLIAVRAQHPKLNVMRIYIKYRYGGRCLISVDVVQQNQEVYIFFLVNSDKGLLKIVTRLEKFRKEH